MSSPIKWNASHMPEHCAEIAADHRRALAIGRPATGKWSEETLVQFSRIATTVDRAPMYWSSVDMTPAIRHVAGRVPPATLRELLPAPSGVLLWGASPTTSTLPTVPDGPLEESTLDGVVWCDAGPDVWLTFLTRGSVEARAEAEARYEGLGRADLANFCRRGAPQSFAWLCAPLDGDSPEWGPNGEWFTEALNLFAATLVLAASEQVASVEDVAPSRHQARRTAGGRAPRPVRVVRMNVAPPTGRHAGESEREHQHRWLVSGHWRSQPYGPGRTKRRLQLIAPYIKGPEGKPFAAPRPVVHHISRPPARPVATGEAA
jgi:hypothetical protein